MNNYMLFSILIITVAVISSCFIVSIILRRRKEGKISTNNRLKKLIISELILLCALFIIFIIGLACGISLDIWKEILSDSLVLSIFLWPIIPFILIVFSPNK